MESKDSTLMEMMTQLTARMDRFEENSKLKKDSTAWRPSEQETKSRVGGMLSMWSGRSFCKGLCSA